MEGKTIEHMIMERIVRPGWVSTRGILMDPAGQLPMKDYQAVEDAMKVLARKGMVVLWTLIVKDGAAEMMAASRPDLNLADDLEQRGAWAKAVKFELEE